MAGHEVARCNLGVIEARSGNLEQAVKHWFDHYDFLLPRDQIVGLLLENSLDVDL